MALQVGCDPGYCGALALLEGARLIDVKDMPVLEEEVPGKLTFTEAGDIKRKVKTIRKLNEDAIYKILLEWRMIDGATAFCIEDVSAMPEDGVASAFKFGHNTGTVSGIAKGAGYHIRRVRANLWKREMGCTADKHTSLGQARARFPGSEAFFKRVKDEGRAEASLIGLWAQRNLG